MFLDKLIKFEDNQYIDISNSPKTPMITNGDHLLNSKQRDIIDSVIEFAGNLPSIMKSTNGNTNIISNVLKEGSNGFKFSEGLINSLEYQFSNASANQIDPLIGNSTMGTLGMIIQEIGSSTDKNGAMSLAFPDRPVETKKILLERIKGNSGIAPEFSSDSAVKPITRPLDTYILQYQSAFYLSACSMQSDDITNTRKRGVGTFVERGYAQMIAYNSINLLTQVITRKKKLISDAVFNNGFSYAGGLISSNIPSANYISLYEPMGTLNPNGTCTYSSTDASYNPLLAFANVLLNPAIRGYVNRGLVKGIIINRQDVQNILNHPIVLNARNYLQMGQFLDEKSMEVTVGKVTKTMLSFYLPGLSNIPFLIDDDIWFGENLDGTTQTTPNDATNPASAQNFFVPSGKAFLLLDLPKIGGLAGAFHLTYNMADPNVTNQTKGIFQGIFHRDLNNSNTINRFDIVASLAGAPAVYMPEAMVIIQNMYSNI